MISLAGLTAADATVQIGGREYTLGQLRQRDNAVIEERIQGKRGDPVEVARRLAVDATEEERRVLFEKAYKDAQLARTVTTGEFDDFCNSPEGYRFIFWLTIRQHHPEVTEDDAGQLLETMGHEWIDHFVDKLQARFPAASRDELILAAVAEHRGSLAELIFRCSGLPEKNSATPGGPGIATDRFRGGLGSPSSVKSPDAGPLTRSPTSPLRSFWKRFRTFASRAAQFACPWLKAKQGFNEPPSSGTPGSNGS